MAEKKSVSNVDSDGTDLRPKLKNFFIFNPKLGNKEGEVCATVILRKRSYKL